MYCYPTALGNTTSTTTRMSSKIKRRVSVVILELFQVVCHANRCLPTVLELSCRSDLKMETVKENLSPSVHVVHTTEKQVISLRRLNEWMIWMICLFQPLAVWDWITGCGQTPTQRTSAKYDNISTLKTAQIDEKYGANKACGSHDGAANH